MIIFHWFLDAGEIEILRKRPLIAKIASDYCKNIFVTDDNPRSEKPEKIRGEILANIKNKNCFDIGSRTVAIKLQ